MDFKTTFVVVFLGLFIQSCGCEDPYGNRIDLVIPLESFPRRSVFSTEDTIYWKAGFPTEVEVKNQDGTASLDGFEFFTIFGISEISSPDTIDFNRPIDIVEIVGEVQLLPSEQNSYPLRFVERNDSFCLEFGVVVNEPGLYTTGFSFLALPEDIDHPIAFECDGSRRTFVELHFQNASTDRAVYDSLYASSPNPLIQRLGTYERYQQIGGITFRVLPK